VAANLSLVELLRNVVHVVGVLGGHGALVLCLVDRGGPDIAVA